MWGGGGHREGQIVVEQVACNSSITSANQGGWGGVLVCNGCGRKGFMVGQNYLLSKNH